MGNCAQNAEVSSDPFQSDNPFDFFNSTAENVTTPTQEHADDEPQTQQEDEVIQTTIFRDDEIETIEVEKKPKKKNPFKVIWTRFIDQAESLYDNVNQNLDNE